jgi:hypothetical protein
MIIIKDDFLKNPYEVRNFALKQKYNIENYRHIKLRKWKDKIFRSTWEESFAINCNKNNITRNEVKLFLDNQKLDTKLIKTIEYNPNQAIIYSANLFHSPSITQEFTEDNPRVLLRIAFDRKITKPKNINYG